MTAYYCQNSSSNINDAANWDTNPAGGGDDLTWASLQPTDILYANGKTAITINVDSWVCAKISNAAGAGTAGGQFLISCAAGARAFSASVEGQDTGTATAGGCLAATLHASNALTITGSVTGGGVPSAYGLSHTTTNGLLTITGNVTGGTNATAYGLYTNALTPAITIGGNVAASTAAAVYAGYHGAYTVSGNVTAASGVPAFRAYSEYFTVTVAGNITSGSDGTFPFAGTANFGPILKLTGTLKTLSMRNGSLAELTFSVGDYPAEANVSDVETYGPTGTEYTGALDLTNLVEEYIKDTVIIGGVTGTFTHTDDYVAKMDVVAADYVIVGYDNYTGGSPGTYPTTATTQAADVAAIEAAVLDTDGTDSTITLPNAVEATAGTALVYAAGQAAQLATDEAAVTAKVAYLDDTQTILGIAGELDMDLYTLLTTVKSTLNTNKDEMIADNTDLRAAYDCEAGTASGGGGAIVVSVCSQSGIGAF